MTPLEPPSNPSTERDPDADAGSAAEGRLADWAAAYEEAVTNKTPPPTPEEFGVPAEMADRWRNAREGMDLLNRVWNREGLSRLSTDDFAVGSGVLAEAPTVPIPGAAAFPFEPGAPLSGPDAIAGARASLHLPGFTILGVIGRGGMGVVYKAIQVSLSREVAIKVLPPGLAAEPSRIRRFRQEAEVAASINDAGVLPVFDVIDAGGVLAIVMPYVEGTDLSRLIHDRRAALRGDADRSGERHAWAALGDDEFLDRILPVLDRVVGAVAVLHRSNVIHRDVKPANVLLDDKGNVWLTDFGLARLGDESTITNPGAQVGTPGYMSPEQCDGRDDLDERVDVFGLAATVFHALSLTLPYGVGRVSANAPPAGPPKSWPRAFRQALPVVLKGLDPERKRRYEDGQAFRDDWERVRRGEPPVGRPAGPVGRLARTARRWARDRSDVVLTAMGLVAVCAVLFRPAAAPNPLGLEVDQGPAAKPPAETPATVRTVVLQTDPPGARVAMAPLDPETGEPDELGLIRTGPGEATPFIFPEVPAGDYLVVVEVPGHGFHEVYRHVPEPDDFGRTSPGWSTPFSHDSWSTGEAGEVILPTVVVPRAPAGMAEFAGSDAFLAGDPRQGLFQHSVRVRPFLLDAREVTVAEYRRVTGTRPAVTEGEPGPTSDDEPVAFVSHHEATHVAEMLGKRLPTEFEYEYAATGGGRFKFPWGNDEPPTSWRFGPAGPPDDPDRTPTDPPVFGLFSNAGEWTSSRMVQFTAPGVPILKIPGLADARAARGATGATLRRRQPGKKELGLLNAASRQGWTRETRLPGLGFRGARSLRPRFFDGD